MGRSPPRKEPPDEPEKQPAQPADTSADAWMTSVDVMNYLKISRTKLWQLVKEQGLPAVKLGGDFRYRKSEIDAWMLAQRHKPEKRDKKD